jgi:uncharacterized membrane protein
VESHEDLVKMLEALGVTDDTGSAGIKPGIEEQWGRKMVCMKYLIALLAVAGVVVSAVALHIHNMDSSAVPPCAISAHFDCGLVGHSRYSVFPARTPDEPADSGKLHIPVAAIGIAGYALIGIVALLGRFRMVLELARIGFFCAAFLSYIEAYVIQMWCIYCLWSQGIITAILIASVVAVLLRRRRRAASMVSVLAEHVD